MSAILIRKVFIITLSITEKRKCTLVLRDYHTFHIKNREMQCLFSTIIPLVSSFQAISPIAAKKDK